MKKDIAADFAAWVRTKPVGEAYDFRDIFECACGQFGLANGYLKMDEPLGASPAIVTLHMGIADRLLEKPWTFGALAARLSNTERQS